MTKIINEILESAKIAYKESVLIDNNILEEKLLSIIGNTKLLLELKKSSYTSTIKTVNETELHQNAISKVKKRVPRWLTKPHQKNYIILVTFMELSKNNNYPISLSFVESNSKLNSREFISHYNQMKSFADKAHGKIFEEKNGKIQLWKPISKFIVDLFQEQDIYKKSEIIINKKKASEIINKDLGKNKLNPKNKGNVKWSNINNKKDVYWINIHINERILDEYHFILNNEKKQEFTHLIIPAHALDKSLFKIVYDKTVKCDKIDLELSNNEKNYLIDIKSGGTQKDFKKYISKVFSY